MPEASPPVDAPRSRLSSAWRRIRRLFVQYVLHVDDTPHRIAFGVALGFLVGATPTIGVQMIIYVALAALLGANKVSGILPVWISNPFTAVPLYYGNWWVGRWLMTGETAHSLGTRNEIAEAIRVPEGQSVWTQLLDFQMWSTLFDHLVELGLELWVGSIVVGILVGAAGYWATLRLVAIYRARRSRGT